MATIPNTEVKFSSLQTVLGGTNPISMSEYFADATTGFSTGVVGIPNKFSAIGMSVFRGKTKTTDPTVGNGLYNFTSHTFTTANKTGGSGPTLAQCRTAYSSVSWTQNTTKNYLNMTIQGIQRWTVPATGSYTITTAGAKGAGYNPGLGIIITDNVTLTKGTILNIVCGQYTNTTTAGSETGGDGGGGGSFVWEDGGSLLIAAGGGGGTGYSGSNAVSGTTAENGTMGLLGVYYYSAGPDGGQGGSGPDGGQGGQPGFGATAGENGLDGTGGDGGSFVDEFHYVGGGGGGGGFSAEGTFLGGKKGTSQSTNGIVLGSDGGFGGGGGGGGRSFFVNGSPTETGGGGGGGGYGGGGGGGGGGGYGGGGSSYGSEYLVANGANNDAGYATIIANFPIAAPIVPFSLEPYIASAKNVIENAGFTLFATPSVNSMAAYLEKTATITGFGQFRSPVLSNSFRYMNKLYGAFFLEDVLRFTIEWTFTDGTNSMHSFFSKTTSGGATYSFKVFDTSGNVTYNGTGTRTWNFSSAMNYSNIDSRPTLSERGGIWGASRTGHLNGGFPGPGLNLNQGWGFQAYNSILDLEQGLYIDSTTRSNGRQKSYIYF
jgi:hypothetical protein